MDPRDFPTILSSCSGDEKLSSEQLLPIVYEELRRIAAAHMARESVGHTLQPTALVHEAWLRLTDDGECSWVNRAHFFGAAAQAMRRILVDHARRKSAHKRKADSQFALPDDGNELSAQTPGNHILMIHESLIRLEQTDPAAARIVLLKFFSGLGSEEIARMLECSIRSVERQWTIAKVRLYQIISEEGFHSEKRLS